MQMMSETTLRRKSLPLAHSTSKDNAKEARDDTKKARGYEADRVSWVQTFLCLGMLSLVVCELVTLHDLHSLHQIEDVVDARRMQLRGVRDHFHPGVQEAGALHASIRQAHRVKLSKTMAEALHMDRNITPNLAWLMSFPNSGTSFTLEMTRKSTNHSAATNYGEEVDVPSVPVFKGAAGENGPFLLKYPHEDAVIPQTILTKTHCGSRCTGRCSVKEDIVTSSAFQADCLAARRRAHVNGKLTSIPVHYSATLVTKAIHIFRHPLDNVVSRFHLERINAQRKDDHEFSELFPKSSKGFRAWCVNDNKHQHFLSSPSLDENLRLALKKIPCFREFFRYVQWHNLAFEVTHNLGIPTLMVHYQDYEKDFERARSAVLSFLDLPLVNDAELLFIPGKTYPDYYTAAEKENIRSFLKEFASAETWKQLEIYDFE